MKEKALLETCRELLISHVLPKYLPHHITKSYYPVVIGGSSVSRCMQSDYETSQMVDDAFSSDIDIDFIVLKNSLRIIESAYKARAEFIESILKDPDFIKFAHDNKQSIGSKQFILIPEGDKATKLNKRHAISIFLQDIHDSEKKVTIMDTIILHPKNTYNYNLFKDIFHSKYPIPKEVDNGILWASCEWIYVDTIRMMMLYDQGLVHSKNDKSFFLKFSRYIMKFCVLYILLFESSNEEHAHIKKAYAQVRKMLYKSTIDANSLFKNTNMKELNPLVMEKLHKLVSEFLKFSNIQEIKQALKKIGAEPKNKLGRG